jgi:hypothetical protein
MFETSRAASTANRACWTFYRGYRRSQAIRLTRRIRREQDEMNFYNNLNSPGTVSGA